VSATDRGTHVEFLVADQGRGIPAGKLGSVFERFEQVDASDSRDKGGTGLGLAICKSIVELHGGTIAVDSTLGEGSTFTFTLPAPTSADKHLPARAPTPEFGLDVLVCDDDPDVRATMTAILESANCRVAAAGSGEVTIALAHRHRPDVILLDLGLPGLTGWQTMARLRADPATADVPIVIVTGARAAEHDEAGGADGWVEKPFRPPALLHAVYSAVRRDPGPARVLVVEDDGDLGRVLGGVLSQQGIETHVVTSVEEAITLMSSYRPELLVLDLNLPDGNGLEVIESTADRGEGSTTPSVVYTAGPVRRDDRERGDPHRTRFVLKGVTDPQALADNVIQLLLAYSGRRDRSAA
jgi:CheY-like chemotaxis protein